MCCLGGEYWQLQTTGIIRWHLDTGQDRIQDKLDQMNISSRKTKETLISKDPPAHLMLCGATVDRVTTFKLLGIRVSSDLKWAEHVDAIVSNAASRIHFLKQLKRAGFPIRDLLHF